MSRLGPRRRLILWLVAVEAVIGLAMLQCLIDPFGGAPAPWPHHAHHHHFHFNVEVAPHV